MWEILHVLVANFVLFPTVKDFKNLLLDKVRANYKVGSFLGGQNVEVKRLSVK